MWYNIDSKYIVTIQIVLDISVKIVMNLIGRSSKFQCSSILSMAGI